jgi:NAD+ diphosphatase
VVPVPKLPYADSGLDRGGSRRADERWISGLLGEQATVIIPMWRDSCLIDGADRVRQCAPEAADLLAACGQPVFLGVRAEGAVFAADLSELDKPAALSIAGATAAADIRALFADLSGPDAAALAYAKGMLRWHREQRFCGACGGTTQAGHGGHQRSCEGCGRLLFPRIEPAVITLVTAPPELGREDRCLLARHRGAKPGSFATLAGFVEIGESFEDAVRREVAEETGVTVCEVSYLGSQPWPFPSGIMIGFRSRALTEAIDVDGDELEEARWFTRDQAHAANVGQRHDSIEHYLIEGWLSEAARQPRRHG